MKHIGLAAVVYTSFVLQASVAPGMMGSLSVHFLLCALVVASVSMDHWTVIVWAAVIGLLSDSLRPGTLGVDMLVATLIALSVQLTGVAGRRRGAAANAVLCLAIPLTALVSTAGLRAFATHASIEPFAIMTSEAGTAVITGACSFVLLMCGNAAGRLLFGFGATERSTASRGYSGMY